MHSQTKVVKKEWHTFRKRKIPTIVPFVYYFTFFNKDNLGRDFIAVHIVNNDWHHFLTLKTSFDEIGEFMLELLLKDKNLIQKRRKDSQTIASEWLSFCRKKLTNVNDLDKKELMAILKTFYDFYGKYSIINVPPWMFLVDKLTYHLLEILSHYTKENINEIFTVLTSPNKATRIKTEELRVLSLSIRIKEENITKFTKLDEFKNLVKDYFYVPFDYLGPELWDRTYYKNKIKELLTFSLETLKRQKEGIFDYQKKLVEKQKDTIKKLKMSSELVDLFEAMKEITLLQDDKKAVTTEAHYYLQQIFKGLSRNTNLSFFNFYYLTYEETEKLTLNSKKISKKIKDRQKLSLSVIENGNLKILVSKEGKQFAGENNLALPSDIKEEIVNELKGSVGSQGKAVGEVRVIESPSVMSKFKEGEILVAPMTSPDYVPIMTKAKAIITNEGGITCHAAIVSREMGIPCIIGTEVATSALKDGDIVEVDAINGIIKIIKRKNS
ncbi:MAG TPA: PEP-utilizing enzyme [Candidatus Nanoarchaeia archaeon]|nr:PEP-utilizing enzyme [Candidatus Nanoarchaeia archaeon]